jgi:hypothetical protein
MKKVLFITFLSFGCFTIETQAQTAVAEKPAAVAAVVDTMVFKPYIGSYKSEMGQIKVWLEDSKLIGELEGQGKGELRLTDKADVLSIEGMDEASVTFIRNDEKKVVKVKINAQGQVIEGDKVE